MANNDREFFINLGVSSKERFDTSKFFEFTDNFDPLTSRFVNTVKNLPEKQKFYVQSEEGRPDVISHRVYGDTQYWWIILLYNDIDDVDNLTIGRVLSLPVVDNLEDLFFSLRSKEIANQI